MIRIIYLPHLPNYKENIFGNLPFTFFSIRKWAFTFNVLCLGIISVLLLLPTGLAYFPAELERIQNSVFTISTYQRVE